MKKNLLIAGLLALVVAGGATAAVRMSSVRWDARIPSLSGVTDIFRRWTAPSVKAFAHTTATCQLLHTGKGLVSSVSLWGDSTGKVVLFDANAIGSLEAAAPDTTKQIAVYDPDTAKAKPSPRLDEVGYADGLVACSAGYAQGVIRFYKQQE